MEVKKPDLLPRKKIRAHTLNVLGASIDTPSLRSASESLSAAYSGYVHAASENVMEMYGGNPPQFHLAGMSNTPRTDATYEDAGNYIYRGLMATTVVAKAYGDVALLKSMEEFLAKYEIANGHELYKEKSNA